MQGKGSEEFFAALGTLYKLELKHLDLQVWRFLYRWTEPTALPHVHGVIIYISQKHFTFLRLLGNLYCNE